MKSAAAVVLLLMLAACAGGEPLEATKADEIPSGPGMFAGKGGEFVIYRR